MTKRRQILIAASFATLLSSCAIDYSPIELTPAGTPQAHVTSGIDGASVYIVAVNDVPIPRPVLGRETIVSAGKAQVKLGSVVDDGRNIFQDTTTLTYEFSPGRYYVIRGNPDSESKKIIYDVSEVSKVAFRNFQCDTQRKAQKRLAATNPQKAPACDEPSDQPPTDPMKVEVLNSAPQNSSSLGKVEVVPDGDIGKDFNVLMAATKELKAKAAVLGANAVVLEGFKKDPATGKVVMIGNALSVPKPAK